MKIHATNSYLNSGYHSHPSEHKVGLYEKNMTQGYNVGFSGSVANESSEAAAKVFNNLGKTWLDKIAKSDKFEKFLEFMEENTVIGQALVALVVAGVLRPATNMAMANKNDREDSMYAASHAIASAVIGFAVSSIIMAPFGTAFRKIKENPKKYLQGAEKALGVSEIGKRKLEKSKAYKNISKFAQMLPDTFIMGVPKAMLTIALIPPILKYVFGWEKKPNGKPNNIKEEIKDHIKYDTTLGLGIMTMEAFLGGKQ